MSDLAIHTDRLLDLAGAACNESASEKDFVELDALLRTDKALRRRYVDYCRLHVALRLELRAHWAARNACRQIGVEAPSAVPLSLLSTTFHSTVGYFSSGWPAAYLAAMAIVGTAIGIFSLIPVHHSVEFAWQPSPPPAVEQRTALAERTTPVARVTGLVDCRWERKGLGIRDWGLEEGSGFRVQGSGAENPPSTIHHPPSTPVRLGDKFALASGLMQLTYDTGAKVILQGPCTYEVDSPTGGFLSLGKLTARVEKRGERREEGAKTRAEGGRRRAEEAANPKSQISKSQISNPQSLIPNPSLATSHQPLFTIHTPTATVTDLGTEFGVEVGQRGDTTSYVFRGSVELRVAEGIGASRDAARILHENESARAEVVDSGQGGARLVVLSPAQAPANFVRKLVAPTLVSLDLVDVVAGGDGFSGRRNRAIDPMSGRVTDTPPEAPAGEKNYVPSDGKYNRVEAIPFVDGVFVPDSGRGPVQVDSAGHTFADFDTSENRVFPDYIWAGGATPPAWASHIQAKLGQTTLGGIDYASPGHCLLFMHANKGITFDLEAIRRANPGCKLLRFRATAGNTEKASEKGGGVFADIRVLVDGKVRFQRREINGYNGAMPILIPIGENDRFLTLATTDGGNGIWSDWIIFGDPRLELLLDRPSSVQNAGGQ